MRDEAGPDAKVLCVPAADPRWASISELEHVADHLRAEIHHFFEIYKALEPGKHTEPRGWEGRGSAEQIVREAFERLGSTTQP